MKKIECDCSCATACPQGRIGSQARCFAWKDEPEADSYLILRQSEFDAIKAQVDQLENRAGNTSVSNARMISKIEEMQGSITSLQERVVNLMNAQEAA